MWPYFETLHPLKVNMNLSVGFLGDNYRFIRPFNGSVTFQLYLFNSRRRFIQLSFHVIFMGIPKVTFRLIKWGNLMSSHSLITVYLLYPLEQLQSPSTLTETCVPSPLHPAYDFIHPSIHPWPVHWILIVGVILIHEIHPPAKSHQLAS